jgi:2C-methyl-D-erythritol 2,4-cyclodiphosphate synthase
MSQDTNNNTNILENQELHRMLSEKDYQLININIKLTNMEDQMKKLVEQNNNMKTEVSRLMSYLVSFAGVVKDDLRQLKNN